MKISICVIAYNRTFSLSRLLESLSYATFPDPVKLYISVDKSDGMEVEEMAENYVWPFGEKEVILHSENMGLKKHIIKCGNLLEKHDALIVLEDDIVVAPGFYLYAKKAVETFSSRKDIAGISLYRFAVNYHSCQPFTPLKEDADVFLMQNAQSWGQVWMKEQWREFKAWYDENSADFAEMPHLPSSICNWSNKSWLKYHTRYCIEQDKYFVYPYESYTTCFSDEGEHSSTTTPLFQTPLSFNTDIRMNFNATVKYDAYFENSKIYEWMNLPKEDLCIDYYGDNKNKERRRYWLSRLILPYKVVKSFGLQLKPYELNIKYSTEGNDLFLYDTHLEDEIACSSEQHKRQFFYLFGTEFIDTAPLEWTINSNKKTIAELQHLISENKKQIEMEVARCIEIHNECDRINCEYERLIRKFNRFKTISKLALSIFVIIMALLFIIEYF